MALYCNLNTALLCQIWSQVMLTNSTLYPRTLSDNKNWVVPFSPEFLPCFLALFSRYCCFTSFQPPTDSQLYVSVSHRAIHLLTGFPAILTSLSIGSWDILRNHSTAGRDLSFSVFWKLFSSSGVWVSLGYLRSSVNKHTPNTFTNARNNPNKQRQKHHFV